MGLLVDLGEGLPSKILVTFEFQINGFFFSLSMFQILPGKYLD